MFFFQLGKAELDAGDEIDAEAGSLMGWFNARVGWANELVRFLGKSEALYTG